MSKNTFGWIHQIDIAMQYMVYAHFYIISSIFASTICIKTYGCDSLPANVLSICITLLTPSSGLSVSPINLTAVTYTVYSVYGLRLVRMYVPSKLVSLTT